MTPTDDRAILLSERIAVARTMLELGIDRLADLRSRLRATREEICAGRARRAVLHDSAYARLQARMATMPVIEQAKGIVMAQTGCDADGAFEVLRQASQRTNRPVREIATQIVSRAERKPPVPGAPPQRELGVAPWAVINNGR